MKRVLFSFFGITTIALLGFSKLDLPVKTGVASIQPKDVRRHIDYLASDALLGRDTPSAGLDTAAAYIAREFRSYGLQPLNGSYFQEFSLNRVKLGEDNFVRLQRAGSEEQSFEIKKDFMPFGLTANREAQSELVFAGYGITAPEYDYDDYAGIEVKGKIVLVLRHEPGEKDSSNVFDGERNTGYSNVRVKLENAIAHGAAGLIVVTDPLHHRSLRPRGFPWPSLYRNIPNEAVPLTLGLLEEEKIPLVQVGKKFIREIFGSVDSLKTLQQEIDADMQPNSFVMQDVTVRLKTDTSIESATTQNVVAVLEGTDLKQQAIVIGAHYDHVGYKHGEVKPGEDYIYNGADDNASGTVGLLEIAEAFSKVDQPRRSVIFIAFAGEEKGLFGSRAYVADPLWRLNDTKAMINLDMIGRNQGDTVTIIGFSKSPDLNQINTEENRYIGLKLDYSGEEFFMRSDQYNFAREGIPVLFYNTDIHEDYHQVGDNPEKINEGKVAMIARLAFRTAWRAANTEQTFRLLLSN